MENQDDLHCLNLVLQGDIAAFKSIVNKYNTVSYQLSMKLLGNKEDAEDVVQDAFVKAFASLKKFDHRSAFSTWLYRIVYNLSIDKIRKRKIKYVEINDAHLIESDPSTNAEKEQRKYLAQAMNMLSVEENALIGMHYGQGLDMKEISLITKTSHAAVRKKISRTREKLKMKLEAMLGEELKEVL